MLTLARRGGATQLADALRTNTSVEALGFDSNLNLSRAIGDLKYKQNGALPPSAQIITAEPDVIEQRLVPADEFMVLACDGVWDVMSNAEVCDYVRARLGAGGVSLAAVAEEVMDRCMAEDPKKTSGIGGDNMTCLIVTFDTTTVPGGGGAPSEFAGGGGGGT